MRVTLPLSLLATHTAPNPVATPSGLPGRSTDLEGSSRPGSIGTAESVSCRVTHTSSLSSFHARLSGCPRSTRISWVSLSDSGSTRLT